MVQWTAYYLLLAELLGKHILIKSDDNRLANLDGRCTQIASRTQHRSDSLFRCVLTAFKFVDLFAFQRDQLAG